MYFCLGVNKVIVLVLVLSTSGDVKRQLNHVFIRRYNIRFLFRFVQVLCLRISFVLTIYVHCSKSEANQCYVEWRIKIVEYNL